MLKAVLVDDEPWVLQGLASIIPWEEIGFDIAACCTNGEEAFAEIAKQKPDAVFTDIRMPGISGIELIAKIREQDINTAIVIISGYSDFDVACEALNYHAYQYLLKPLEPKKVESVAKELARTLIQPGTNLPDREEMQRRAVAENGRFTYSEHPAVADIQYFLGTNFREEISLRKLSEHFFLTETYLCELFRKHTGKTILSFLRSTRLNHAKRLLREHRLSLTDFAEQVGYNDYSYFGKLFKTEFKITPEEFRKTSVKMHRGNGGSHDHSKYH